MLRDFVTPVPHATRPSVSRAALAFRGPSQRQRAPEKKGRVTARVPWHVVGYACVVDKWEYRHLALSAAKKGRGKRYEVRSNERVQSPVVLKSSAGCWAWLGEKYGAKTRTYIIGNDKDKRQR